MLEVLQLMAVFTNDKRFEEVQNLYIKGEESTICEVLDEIVAQAEARGVFNLLYKLIKKGRMTIEEAASDLRMTIEQLLAGFKEHNLVL